MSSEQIAEVVPLPTSEAVEKREAEPGVRPCGLSQDQVLKRVPGISYRQLDYWTRTGRIKNHRHNGAGEITERSGSGFPACWPYGEIARARRLARLLDMGFDLTFADELANNRESLKDAMRSLIQIEVDLILAQSGESGLRFLLGLDVAE